MMSAKESVDRIILCLGGTRNIISVTNCMTRLRVVTKDDAPVTEAAYDSGFSGTSYFIQLYKKKYNVTPGKK